jgi:hypothetical protein
MKFLSLGFLSTALIWQQGVPAAEILKFNFDRRTVTRTI